MKKLALLCIALMAGVTARSQALTFTVTNVTGSTTLTCGTPSIVLNLSSSTPGVTYSLISMSSTQGGNSHTITTQGNYLIMAYGATQTASQSISVYSNTTTPAVMITPTVQSITCSNPAIANVTISAVSPASGITHVVASPTGTNIFTTNTVIYSPGPGTHTYTGINNATGCSVTRTFVVLQTTDMPTLTVVSNPTLTSLGGFTLGCGTHSMVGIQISAANTNPTPGGALEYAFLPPNYTGIITTSPAPNYTVVTLPGTWTVVAKQISNGCITQLPVIIDQNTLQPVVTISSSLPMLSCSQPTLLLQASSTPTNVSYSWDAPTGPTVTASSIAATTVAPASATIAGVYTVTVVNLNNMCTSYATYTVTQNILPPVVNATPPQPFNLCSSSTVTIYPTLSGPVSSYTFQWSSPPGASVSGTTSSNLTTDMAGMYIVNVTNTVNGCSSNGSVTVGSCVGFAGQEKTDPLRIFPNPGTGLFVIDRGYEADALVSVYNITGMLVKEFSIHEKSVLLDLTHDANGIYIVRLSEQNKGTSTVRLIKH